MDRGKIAFYADKIAEYCIYAMIFFIPVSSAAIEIFFSLGFTAFIVKKIAKPQFQFLKDKAYVFLLLFILFCMISMTHSGIYLGKSIRALLFKWLEGVYIFALIQDTIKTPKRIRNTIALIIISGLIVCLDGFYQHFAGTDFFCNRHLIIGRVTATFKNQNGFGAYLVPLILLIITLASSPQLHKKYKIGLLILAILSSLCLLFTQSRGAWFGFFAGFLLLLLLFRNYKTAIPIIFLIILALFLIPELKVRVYKTFMPYGEGRRWELFYTAWLMIKENPLIGKGLGTFMDYFPKCSQAIKEPHYAHNSYLQVWAETGFFSLLAFLSFWSLLIKRGIKAFMNKRDIIILGFTCALFGLLAHAFFESHFYSLQLSALVWSTGGILAALIKK